MVAAGVLRMGYVQGALVWSAGDGSFLGRF